MRQRLQLFAIFGSVFSLAVALVALVPCTAHAQNACVTGFEDATGNLITDGGSACQVASGTKCTFQLSLCLNEPGTPGGTCTGKTFKPKKIHTTGHCGGVGKLSLKPSSGTAAQCQASPATISVHVKKKAKRAATCRLRVKGNALTKVVLSCQPSSGSCPSTTTTTAISSSTTTTMAQPCTCHTPAPTKLSFTTGIGSGNCGMVQASSGTVLKNLACSGLFTGGGSNSVPLPYAVPDMGNSLTKATCSANNLTLSNLTSADTGSNRNCTSVGCLFGPPLPIPNSASTPTSVCVVNVVATNASGTADCNTGDSHLNLPLTSQLYLDGDLFPLAPGIQVCPVCTATCTGGTNPGGPCQTNTDCGGGTCGGSNVCHGGGNDTKPCTPADSVIGTLSDFPTSQDCPPPVAMNIGSLPIAFDLTTGTKTLTAVNNTASGQNNVLCGYCQDGNSGTLTGCFAGNQSPACPTPRPAAPIACTSNAGCPAAYPDCVQNHGGAFGPSGGGAKTITETGSPAGNMTDGAAHPSTLASIFCIQPTFNATVDAAGDLPGPGAVTLQGTAQLE
jgi:hypothetical protein